MVATKCVGVFVGVVVAVVRVGGGGSEVCCVGVWCLGGGANLTSPWPRRTASTCFKTSIPLSYPHSLPTPTPTPRPPIHRSRWCTGNPWPRRAASTCSTTCRFTGSCSSPLPPTRPTRVCLKRVRHLALSGLPVIQNLVFLGFCLSNMKHSSVSERVPGWQDAGWVAGCAGASLAVHCIGDFEVSQIGATAWRQHWQQRRPAVMQADGRMWRPFAVVKCQRTSFGQCGSHILGQVVGASCRHVSVKH